MYKKQMALQKAVCLLAIIASVIVFLYALGIMTDLYDCLYDTMRNTRNLRDTDVSGSIVYYEMQSFNSDFLKVSIGLILISCLLYLTNTHVRRRYYIGNCVAVGLSAIANLATAVWAHMEIEFFKARFLQIDFAALKEHAEMWGTAYTESTFWFDIHYLVFFLTIAVNAALVANLVWKFKLMKEEQELLQTGRRATA